MDSRKTALTQWSAQQLQALGLIGTGGIELLSVSGDASFRRYFRAVLGDSSVIAVDAPPDREDSFPFVSIANHWHSAGIAVPRVLASDLELGFMLLDDLGDDLLLAHLNVASVDDLYAKAVSALVEIQRLDQPHDYPLPAYSAAKLESEMQLCPEWFFSRLLGIDLSSSESALLENVFALLIDRAVNQPQVCVHRDFHSRNLMLLQDDSIGIIDFQDACLGPVTYDLASLIRDCYISWSKPREREFVRSYLQAAEQRGVLTDIREDSFIEDFEWMGLQRHIKCVGIFSRLCLRDGKAAYLRDIPRTFTYLQGVCARYSEFSDFHQWLCDTIVPAIAAHPDLPSLAAVEVTA